MYTEQQLTHVYSLLTDTTNNIFSLSNQKVLEYLNIPKKRKFINALKDEFYLLYNKHDITAICRTKQAQYGNKIKIGRAHV